MLLELDTDQYYARPEGGGHAIVKTYFEQMKKYDGLDVLWETQAVKLITNDAGEVIGVKVRKSDGRLHSILGSPVMLACGGFEGNQEMLAKYIGPRTQSLPLIAPGLVHNRGAGLEMALEVGAATSGAFDGIHSEMVDARTDQPDSVIWGHCYGIVVNKHCKRYYDEGKRQLFATFEMIALETWRDQDNEAYLIFDKPVADKFIPGWVYQTTDKDPEIGSTIPELAEKLGLDPKKLEETVNEFNAACNDKPWDTMKLDGKATTGLSPNKSNWANPIAKGPFYGFPLKTTLTFTYGGLKTDLESRVVAPNNAPIPGLYAAGELTGAFYHEVSCLPLRASYLEFQHADTQETVSSYDNRPSVIDIWSNRWYSHCKGAEIGQSERKCSHSTAIAGLQRSLSVCDSRRSISIGPVKATPTSSCNEFKLLPRRL